MRRAGILIVTGLGAVIIAACGFDLSGYSDGAADAAAETSAEAGTSGGDATVETGATCATFTCGDLCVPPNDPAFGCLAARSCQACEGPANGTSTCTASGCAVACSAPFLDCNGKASDGCEIDPTSDPENCGSCGHACPTATPYCIAGKCSANCSLTLCGTSCVDTQTSLANCGGCGAPCSQPTNGNGTASCAGAKCKFTCANGYADCDQKTFNGCETFVDGNDVTHCGSCSPCPAPPPNSVASCTAGKCASACAPSWVDCNGVGSDGCECNVMNNIICRSDKTCAACSNFGDACGTSKDCCGFGSRCVGGTCQDS